MKKVKKQHRVNIDLDASDIYVAIKNACMCLSGICEPKYYLPIIKIPNKNFRKLLTWLNGGYAGHIFTDDDLTYEHFILYNITVTSTSKIKIKNEDEDSKDCWY